MSRQVWGTFSVKDHCVENAFIEEVMLYDRLVIPVPPDDAEISRWEEQGWAPERQDKILEILGDRAFKIKWDNQRIQNWKTRYDHGKSISFNTADWAFEATRTELTDGLPRNITGVQAVTNYRSYHDMNAELGLRHVPGDQPFYGGQAIAVVGYEFLHLQDDKRDYFDLLKEAVALSSEREFKRKRTSFWRWQREFLDSKGITDQLAIQDSIEEMYDLLEDERKVVRKHKLKAGSKFAFLVGSVVLGMVGGPLTPVALASAFLSVGQYAADKYFDNSDTNEPTPASLLIDIQKHFGWEK